MYKGLTNIYTTLLLLIFQGAFVSHAQTYYTSLAAGGDWSTNGTWAGGTAPGTTLASGDTVEIIANSTVTYSAELEINGVLIIRNTGSLEGFGDNLKIGAGSNAGYVFNYGKINARKIEVKGIDKTYAGDVPLLTNWDTIVTGKIHTGTNSEAGTASSGKTINRPSGYILVSSSLGEAKGELHVDGEMDNCGICEAQTIVKMHGSVIGCCGALYTPKIEFDGNKDRMGTLSCGNVCTAAGSSTSTQWCVKGGSCYNSLKEMTDDVGSGSSGSHEDGTDFSIDSTDAYDCGTALDGGSWGGILPVQLLYFKATIIHQSVEFDWSTASELNNERFEIEFSDDGNYWYYLAEHHGMGTTNERTDYSLFSPLDFSGRRFYRLIQYDYDGRKNYHPIITITTDKLQGDHQYRVFPNPGNGVIHIEGKSNDLEKIEVISSEGRVVFSDSNPSLTGSLDLSDLPSGIYNLHLTGQSLNENHMLIIQ